MPTWDRKIFEKENPTTTTETNSAPALLSTPATVSSGPAEVFSVVNPSNSQSINLYDDDTLTFVVLPNTSLTLDFPITFNNSLKVNNTGVSALDYSIQFVSL